MRGNEEIIHFETHSQSSFYTIISIYPRSSIFILTPKKISFSLGIKKRATLCQHTSQVGIKKI